MIKTLLKQLIIEECINFLFDTIYQNLKTPAIDVSKIKEYNKLNQAYNNLLPHKELLALHGIELLDLKKLLP